MKLFRRGNPETKPSSSPKIISTKDKLLGTFVIIFGGAIVASIANGLIVEGNKSAANTHSTLQPRPPATQILSAEALAELQGTPTSPAPQYLNVSVDEFRFNPENLPNLPQGILDQFRAGASRGDVCEGDVPVFGMKESPWWLGGSLVCIFVDEQGSHWLLVSTSTAPWRIYDVVVTRDGEINPNINVWIDSANLLREITLSPTPTPTPETPTPTLPAPTPTHIPPASPIKMATLTAGSTPFAATISPDLQTQINEDQTGKILLTILVILLGTSAVPMGLYIAIKRSSNS